MFHLILYNLYKEKIDKIKTELLAFRFEKSVYPGLEEFNKNIHNANGINFYYFYDFVYKKITEDETYNNDLFDNTVPINEIEGRLYTKWINYLISSFIFKLNLRLDAINYLVSDIFESTLERFQMIELLTIIKEELLNDYLLLTHSTPSNYSYKIFNRTIKRSGDIYFKSHHKNKIDRQELKVFSVFEEFEFDKLAKNIEKKLK